MSINTDRLNKNNTSEIYVVLITSGEFYNNENPPEADAHKKDITCLSQTNDVNILL